MARVLILGGTREAVELADLLATAGVHVTTSLAGVTSSPQRPKGDVRGGGFGGIDGLAAFASGFDLIADATHPFAARISAHAVAAAARIAIPCLRLERPQWLPGPGDTWIEAADAEQAAALAPPGSRLLLTTGRKDLTAFFARRDLSGVVRMIEPPAAPLAPGWALVLERPPFTLHHETELMNTHAITHLVCKNSGGGLTEAKLVAAREKKIPVIMMARPVKPEAPAYADAPSLAAAIFALLAA
jgi:precorrin-6A/cobalt-precorrin-6A reductase